jgi:exodeoxyribonuclease-3
MIKIATFNVNSVKARLPRLLEWLKSSNPDIVCLQELKCEESSFPFEALIDAGYNSAVFGQKTYNGVAILSKYKIEDVVKGLPDFEENSGIDGGQDLQARYIEAVISFKSGAIRVASVYVPNGGGDLNEGEKLEDSKKFIYKIKFLQRLRAHIANISHYDEIQIFGGDYNVACETIDIFDPKKFDGQILFHPQERQKFREILNGGLIDSYRAKYPHNQAFSWWDYRGNSYTQNKGARIDYLLISPNCADKIIDCDIEDKNVRDQEKASDHCPVCLNILI